MDAMLVLEDGRTFRGRAFGAAGERTGQVAFDTEMTGSSPGPHDSFGLFHEFGQRVRPAAGCRQPRVEELP